MLEDYLCTNTMQYKDVTPEHSVQYAPARQGEAPKRWDNSWSQTRREGVRKCPTRSSISRYMLPFLNSLANNAFLVRL